MSTSIPGHLAVCELLVRAGSPLDEVTSAGLKGGPLHYAAGKGWLEVVELLLDAGADKDLLSEDNCTPLYYAVLGQTELEKHLMISAVMLQESISP